jgi:hypothetical protein
LLASFRPQGDCAPILVGSLRSKNRAAVFRSFFAGPRPVALTRPLHRGAGSVVSLRGLLPRAAPATRPPICEGRHSEDHHQFSKKKTMKTTSQNQIISSELINRSHHQSKQGQPQTAPAAAEAAVAPERKDNRLPIDSEARKANRTLPTPKVLTLLHQQLPAAYRLAEVVGKWIWVQFKEQPAAEIRQQLAQLGFHWNRERQAWQHPCGQFSLSSAQDPHEKYSSYHPARVRRTKKQTPEAVAA